MCSIDHLSQICVYVEHRSNVCSQTRSRYLPSVKTVAVAYDIAVLYLVYTIEQKTWSRHRANVEQTSSKYEARIKHSLHEAIIKQTSSWLVQLTYSSSRSQLVEPA